MRLRYFLAGALAFVLCGWIPGPQGSGGSSGGAGVSFTADPLVLDDGGGLQTYLSVQSVDGYLYVGTTDGGTNGTVRAATFSDFSAYRLYGSGLQFAPTRPLFWGSSSYASASDLALVRDGAPGRLKVYDPSQSQNSAIGIYNNLTNASVWLTYGAAGGQVYVGSSKGSANGQVNAATLVATGQVQVGNSTVSLQKPANGVLGVLDTNGGGAHIGVASEELTGLSGASASTTNLVPAGARLLGVSVRVTTLIEGATSFDVGDGVDADLYAATVALTAGTTTDHGDYTADPESFSTSAQDVTLTANGSNFTAGAVRVTAFYLAMQPPGS